MTCTLNIATTLNPPPIDYRGIYTLESAWLIIPI